jgi:flagellar biosynthesis protein FlhA
MGFVMPAVRILDNMQLGANEYRIRVKEVESGRGELPPGQILLMDPKGLPVELPGTHTTEPAFGLPATWVDQSMRDEASFRGYTVVDPGTVLTTHLTEVLKTHMSELLSYAETKKLLDDLPAEQKKLVEELIPVANFGHGRTAGSANAVVRTRLHSRSAGDSGRHRRSIGTHQECHADYRACPGAACRQLCHQYLSPQGFLPIVAMSPAWEQNFADSLSGEHENRQLAMAPSQLQAFIQTVRERFDEAATAGDSPVLLTSPLVRPYARSIIERFRAQTPVMSQNEIHPSVRLRTMGKSRCCRPFKRRT